MAAILQERQRRQNTRKFFTYYPDEGPLRRELYPKHMEFFEAGLTFRERLAMCANRIGKTEGMGGYETTAHLTGLYPEWWPGRRFTRPISTWAAGKKNDKTRDIIQYKLIGTKDVSKTGKLGTGLIPGDHIGRITRKQGVAGLADTISVRHVSGGWSELTLKSYQEGRDGFEGEEQDLIWLDEEPPSDVYEECLLRTMTTKGMVMTTFTPLEGLSTVVLNFMPKEYRPHG